MSDNSKQDYYAAFPPLDATWAARREAAGVVRELSDLLVNKALDGDAAAQLAANLRALLPVFDNAPSFAGKTQWAEAEGYDSFGIMSIELCPLLGASNPRSMPMQYWVEGDQAFARCQLGWAFEGPPERLHGGFVAAIFDQFLGMAQTNFDKVGMTSKLEISYHKATPLNAELLLEAQLLSLDEGRHKRLRATLCANGKMTASCEADFIIPKKGFITGA